MNYYIAVFKSRSFALNFANLLRQNGIPCAIVNTPTSIGKSCGISVKFLGEYYAKVTMFLSPRFSNFLDGIYPLKVTINNLTKIKN